MGLAASQARFLAITARKADCEFRSMQIAQNKLSVTREMELATQDYQQAINATKMVWDYDGNQSFLTDISYGFLMTPSYLNNFNPYLITNRGGQVIVDSKIASAARRAGIDPNKGGNRNADSFADFVWALYDEGFMSQSSMDEVESYVFPGPSYGNDAFECGTGKYVYLNADGSVKETRVVESSKGDGHYLYVDASGKPLSKYDPNAGYGSVPMSKNEYTDTGILGLAQRLKKEGLDFKCTNGSDDKSGLKLSTNYDISFSVDSVVKGAISLSDVLTSNVSYLAVYPDGKHSYTDESKGISDNVGKFLRNAIINIARVIYGKDGNGNWRANTIEDIIELDKSLYTAYTFTAKHYGILEGKEITSPQVTLSYDRERDSKVSGAVKDKANEVTEIVWGQNSGGSYNSSASVNLSNLLGYCLTAYDNFVTGWNSNYTIDQDMEDCFFVTHDPDFKFAVLSENTETNETVMKSDFYMQLYNNLCINGYVVDKNITDNKYLEQMLKNGSYFMCGVNDKDGYFYQARYSDDVRTLIKVVNDEDAKTQAETEYAYKKARLTAKEDRLDLEMKNIDMEIASLTSEYDSVKNLISKSVEKTFKQFES